MATEIFDDHMITPDEHKYLDHLFAHHPPTGHKAEKHEAVRNASRHLAAVIYRHCPATPERTLAIRAIQTAMMWGNASIALYPEIEETRETHQSITAQTFVER